MAIDFPRAAVTRIVAATRTRASAGEVVGATSDPIVINSPPGATAKPGPSSESGTEGSARPTITAAAAPLNAVRDPVYDFAIARATSFAAAPPLALSLAST